MTALRSMRPTVRVAAVQATPAFLDREETLNRADALVEEAAVGGAQLIVFPEAFVPGYPDFVWRLPAWSDGSWYRRLAENSVTVPGRAVDRLAELSRRSGAWLVMGVNERTPSGTLHNTLLYLSPDHGLAGLHRKLVATGAERSVWGPGDGSTLTVVNTPFGRVGGMTCWENYMPLARAAMYEQGVDVWVAPTWDNSDAWPATLRHIAREGRVYVVGVNTCIRGADVPRALDGAAELYGGEDDWMSRGNTAIVGPDGSFLAGPLIGETGILYADLDLGAVTLARREFDPVGHYARPDVFSLHVERGDTRSARRPHAQTAPPGSMASDRVGAEMDQPASPGAAGREADP